MAMSIAFTGDTADEIDRQIERYLRRRAAPTAAASPEDIDKLMRRKAASLASTLSDNPRLVLRTMVELHRQGQIPTPPLLIKELNVAKGKEQGARAWIGKVRAAIEAIDKAEGGPPILIGAPFVDGHTRYQLDDRGANAVAEVFDEIEKMIEGLSAK
jgi:hypothetical protein